MIRKTGALIFFDENQRAELIRDYFTSGVFSDALSIPDLEPRKTEVALLAFSEETVDFISLMKRGRTVATAKSRVEFSDLVSLNVVPIKELEVKLDPKLRSYFIRSSRGIGGMLPETTWDRIISHIKELRPDTTSEIERLMSLSSYAGYQLDGKLSEILLQEREALGAALDIFSGNNQLRERVLGSWAPPAEIVTELDEETKRGTLVSNQSSMLSFSNRIPEKYIQEESALQHDLFNWKGIAPMHVAGHSIFTQGKRTLEVLYANRNSLEHTLGVDLIYYNEEYQLFALVQYKLMREENERMVYRPDWQLHQELKRMDEFVEKYHLSQELQSDQEFRLNADGFFVKLVPNRGLRPASGELIKGMYLTREYLKYLLGPFGPKGDKGGPVIHFDNAQRYLTNTEFVQSVNRGWIGMRRLHSRALKDLIRQYYETGRGVLVAVEELREQESLFEESAEEPNESGSRQLHLFEGSSRFEPNQHDKIIHSV